MYSHTWSFKETNLRIKCDDERAIDAAIEASLQARRDIEKLVLRYPEFRWSLEPLKIGNEQSVKYRGKDYTVKLKQLTDESVTFEFEDQTKTLSVY